MSKIYPITECHQPQVCWTKTSRFVSTVDLIYMTWIHVGSNHATIESYIVKWGLLSICPVRNLSGTVHPRALQDLQVSLCWKARCWKASETELKNSFQPKGCVIVLKSTLVAQGDRLGVSPGIPVPAFFFVNGWRQGQSLQVNLPCKQWNLGKSHPVWVGCVSVGRQISSLQDTVGCTKGVTGCHGELKEDTRKGDGCTPLPGWRRIHILHGLTNMLAHACIHICGNFSISWQLFQDKTSPRRDRMICDELDWGSSQISWQLFNPSQWFVMNFRQVHHKSAGNLLIPASDLWWTSVRFITNQLATC